MSFPRERIHDKEARDFISALLSLASLAQRCGLNDYAAVLDALHDGAVVRLATEEPVPFTVVD
jgi:hypothetical protein